jgi:Rap1 Myb domain
MQLLRYICEKKRYADTGGVSLWQTMEAMKVVPNRSWASLKERFRKVQK